MKFRYSYLDPHLREALKQFRALEQLFSHLMLQAGGDVEEVLRVLRLLQQRGYLDPKLDLEAFLKRMQDQGLLAERRGEPGVLQPTAKWERTIRSQSLNEIFHGLRKGGMGEHRTPHAGAGGERLPETRPYAFGDSPMDLDFVRSTHNALSHSSLDDLQFTEEDFEVYETEHHTSCATVLLLDLSHSMILYGEDRITPAKRVALALTDLILTRYPKDSLDIVTFGDEAKEISIAQLPYVKVGPFHTNTKAGLARAQQILRRRKHVNKQIFMITDGKPSAIFEGGHLYKNPFGLDPKIEIGRAHV